jgi:DHA1 family inner membrane transport protein
VLAIAAAVVIGCFVPADGPREVISAGSQLAALRSRRFWLLLAGTVFVTGGYMATFSYIAPLLSEGSRLPARALPLVLAGYGVGALAGTNAGGRLADRWPVATFISAADALDSCFGVAGPALAGAVMAAVGLVPLIALAAARVQPAAPAAAGSRPHTAIRDEVLPERELNDYRN